MSTPIELEDAERRIAAQDLPSTAVEAVDLGAADGRTLAADLHSDGPWPATDRSAMDGFALALHGEASASREFAVVGEALAGKPFPAALRRGEAVRIMTGAVVPPGADAVAKVEDSSGFGGIEGDARRVRILTDLAVGANIRRQGSEIDGGAKVLSRGCRLSPAEIGVLAVLGEVRVPVFVAPRVAIVSTGDEVVDVGAVPLPHQVRDSNSHALAAQCRARGAEAMRLGIAPDDEAGLRGFLTRGLSADVLITIGGVSKGTHDLVHGTLAALGVREIFHGVKLKPGKPTFFGRCDRDGRSTFVFGLPGNPASTFTTFELFVAPLLTRMLGGAAVRASARLRGAPPPSDARQQAIPARLRTDDEGRLWATLAAVRPSGDPFGLTGADALALVPARATLAEGDLLRVVPLRPSFS